MKVILRFLCTQGTTNILDKQLRTEWSSSLGVGRGANSYST